MWQLYLKKPGKKTQGREILLKKSRKSFLVGGAPCAKPQNTESNCSETSQIMVAGGHSEPGEAGQVRPMQKGMLCV